MVNEEPKCVQWKRLGAERIRKELEGFTTAEKVEYWRKKTEESRARQQATRKRLAREGIQSIDDIYDSLGQFDELLTMPGQHEVKLTTQSESVPLSQVRPTQIHNVLQRIDHIMMEVTCLRDQVIAVQNSISQGVTISCTEDEIPENKMAMKI